MEVDQLEIESLIEVWLASRPEYEGKTCKEFTSEMSGRYGAFTRKILDSTNYDSAFKVCEQHPLETRLNNRVQLRIRMIHRGLASTSDHSVINHVDHPILAIMAEDYIRKWFNVDSEMESDDMLEQAVLDYLTCSLLDLEDEFDLDEICISKIALVPPRVEVMQ